MAKYYQIGGINYDDIKFNIEDQAFFNFQFEAPQQLVQRKEKCDEFWFEITHSVHYKLIKEYPQIRRCKTQPSTNGALKIRRTNKFKYFMKYVSTQKKPIYEVNQFQSTNKK